MPQLQPIGRLIGAYLVGLFYGTMVCISVLFRVIVKGPRTVFSIRKRNVRPEVLDNPDFGQHDFARLKHITLHYVAKGDPGKPLMLFLHGFPEFWYSWRHQLKEFSNTHRVVAVDMRGYGESQKPRGVAQYSTDKLAADIKDLVAHLGYEKCTLVAHDWGGAVAFAVAQFYPEIVDKLVACNIPHMKAMQKVIQKSTKQFRMSWYIFLFQWPLLPEIMLRCEDLKFLEDAFTKKGMGAKSGAFTDEDIEAYKYTFRNFEDITAPINYYRASIRYNIKYPTTESGKLEVPTLMIWGTADKALSRELPEESRNYIQDFTLRYVDGASHWVQCDEPAKVNQYIREFIGDKKME